MQLFRKKWHCRRLISRPVEITLGPTLKCNSNCVMCNRNYSRKDTKQSEGFLSWDVFERVRPLFKFFERIEFSGFGEGFMHPEYLKMLKEIKKSGPDVRCFSNGVLMHAELGKGLVDAQNWDLDRCGRSGSIKINQDY